LDAGSLYASPRRLRTESQRCFTISSARAAKPISSSLPKSFNAKDVGAPPEYALSSARSIAVFTAAFEPVKKQIEAAQKTAQT
jgi:hypothetical protein